MEDVKEKVIKSIREKNERKEKKKNNVIFNLPEFESETQGSKKDTSDIAMCSDTIGNEVSVPQVEIMQVTPMGNPREGKNTWDTKPRPLLVKAGEVKDKW